MNDFAILGAAASGMAAERAAMDTDARNVALAQTGDARHPAYGQVPRFVSLVGAEDMPPGATGSGEGAPDGEAAVTALEARIDGTTAGGFADAADRQDAVVAYGGSTRSATPIDTVGEMVNVLDAQRAYEANASVFDLGKRLIERTIEMGRVQ